MQVHLQCAHPDATVFYTLDGTLPTQRFDSVEVDYQYLILNEILISKF
jgi:hypothetical protein